MQIVDKVLLNEVLQIVNLSIYSSSFTSNGGSYNNKNIMSYSIKKIDCTLSILRKRLNPIDIEDWNF